MRQRDPRAILVNTFLHHFNHIQLNNHNIKSFDLQPDKFQHQQCGKY